MHATGGSVNRVFGPRRWFQHGATAVEFAFVSIALVLLLLGIIQFGLLMFTFNSAAEATRRGARLAVVSLTTSTVPTDAMRQVMPLNPTCTMSVIPIYMPGNPEPAYMEASVANCTVQPWFFWLLEPVAVPSFTTILPRESLGNN